MVKSNMKEKIGMIRKVSRVNSRRKGNGLRENLKMIMVPEIIIGEMIG